MSDLDDNQSFKNVMNIMSNADELRPLIFEHQGLLKTLRDMKTLSDSQILAIVNAVEDELMEEKDDSVDENDELEEYLRKSGLEKKTSEELVDNKTVEDLKN